MGHYHFLSMPADGGVIGMAADGECRACRTNRLRCRNRTALADDDLGCRPVRCSTWC